MIIETERLRIRPYSMDDFAALYEILSDRETMKYYPKPYDEDGVRRWINWCLESYETNGFGLWALELKSTGAFIGDCGISMQKIDGELLPEIGYHVNKRYWRQGYGREASLAVLDWAFASTDLKTIYSYMTKGNIASYSLAESLGMKRIKEYTDEDGEEMFVYELSK